jgi:hypothetical protein
VVTRRRIRRDSSAYVFDQPVGKVGIPYFGRVLGRMSGSLGLVIKALLIPYTNMNLSRRVSEEVQFRGTKPRFDHEIHFFNRHSFPPNMLINININKLFVSAILISSTMTHTRSCIGLLLT